MDEMMEIGEGLIVLPDGWFLEKATGNKVSPDGVVYDKNGEVVYTPEGDEDI